MNRNPYYHSRRDVIPRKYAYRCWGADGTHQTTDIAMRARKPDQARADLIAYRDMNDDWPTATWYLEYRINGNWHVVAHINPGADDVIDYKHPVPRTTGEATL